MIKLLLLFLMFLTIFLVGITIMRLGLYNLSGETAKKMLISFADHPVKGLITGTVITALIHSSAAVMVITVGLVAAGYLTFKQSIGIMLGSNIGTTFTAEMITFDIYQAILPLFIVGGGLLLMKRSEMISLGLCFWGCGCLFFAMKGFETLTTSLSSISIVHTLLQTANENSLFGVVTGTVITAIIQSSTATTGIVMSFLTSHSLTLSAGIAIILGSNIGTCITAFFASIGSTKEAKLTAYAHIWLNVIGVAIFYPFIPQFTSIAEHLTTLPDLQLAHISLLFNLLCSLIVLPFIGPFSSFIMTVHK